MARTLELDTIQTPSANNANIQLGSDTVTFSSNIAVDINNATIDGATINTSDITVGPGKTLDVQNGTLTTSATQNKAIIEGAGANVDLGANEVRAETFQSDVATGTAPLTVASTTKVTNLNADKLDGYDSSDLFNLDHADVSGVLDVDHGGTNVSTLAGQAQGTNPETYRRKFFRGSNTNTAAAPAFGQIDSADLPVYVGSTSSAVGLPGAVPSATIAEKDQFLKGDGTYATPTDTNTVTSVGTSSSNRTSGNIDITGGTNVTTSKSGSTITIASTDTNTVTSVGTESSNRTSGNIDIVGGTNVTTSKSGGTITINSSSYTAGSGLSLNGTQFNVSGTISANVGTTTSGHSVNGVIPKLPDGTGSYGSIYVTGNSQHDVGSGNNNVVFQKSMVSTLASNSSSYQNVIIGNAAGGSIDGGNTNTLIGHLSGFYITSGYNNTCLGKTAGFYTSGPGGKITTTNNNVVIGNGNVANAYVNTSWTTSSDERDKTDIEDFSHGLDFVKTLRPVTYRWDKRFNYLTGDEPEDFDINSVTRDGSKKQPQIEVGLIAQEVLAEENKIGYATDENNDLFVKVHNTPDSYGMNYERLTIPLINAVKELSAQVEELATRVAALEG